MLAKISQHHNISIDTYLLAYLLRTAANQTCTYIVKWLHAEGNLCSEIFCCEPF